MSQILRPCYRGGPIKSVDLLSRALGIDVALLALVAAEIEKHYRLVKIQKDDGSFRECWDPSEELRTIQKRIADQFLRKVRFPDYLHGALPGRDYISNASAHVGARWCICLDIKSFFPNVSAQLVNAMWTHFFGNAPSVSKLLTELTTLDEKLPQGSLTASYIANLVLWRKEHSLVEALSEIGFRYTRYVDDIAISSAGYPSQHSKTQAVQKVQFFLRGHGLHLKRTKTEVQSRAGGIRVVGLQVGARVGRSKDERGSLAKSVIQFSADALLQPASSSLRYARSLRGRVAELGRHHPREATHLREYLDSQLAALNMVL